MTIEQNIQKLQQRINKACEKSGRSPAEVTLVAVSKTVEADVIEAAFNAGLRHFGESRVQESASKIEQLQKLKPDIVWHMVGHLQTNKAKTAANIFDIIHSVDSLKLAETLSNSSQRKLRILIQVNVVDEATKSGFALSEVNEAVRQIGKLPNLEIEGLMTIAPWVSDTEEARPAFRQLRQLRDALGLRHLSMGMTDDFEVAIEEGATLVRIGRAIFGERS
ncbi:MAG: YggS family pyridoxal phosphate enzyme [Chloroflexi bacterium RBG_13_52_14]|nr:MAG: YggS family pyridoxal phosphate enzyme [Chloroflexi bacterium RBG_13_52_14]